MRFFTEKHIPLAMIGVIAVLSGGCLGREPMTTPRKEIETRVDLLRTYEGIEGTYRGRVSDPGPGDEPFPIEVRLYTVEENSGVNSNGEPTFRPALRGYYRRLDIREVGIGDYVLTARYIRETGELIMESSPTQGLPGRQPGVGYLSLSGVLEDGEIRGRIRNHLDDLGEFALRRVSPRAENAEELAPSGD